MVSHAKEFPHVRLIPWKAKLGFPLLFPMLFPAMLLLGVGQEERLEMVLRDCY